MSGQGERAQVAPPPDPEGLLIALIFVPHSFSRNKFFELYQIDEVHRTRRRAQIIRSVIQELTEPWPHGGEFAAQPAPVIQESIERDGALELTYSVSELGYQRSVSLDRVEAAAFRYALHRAGKGPLREDDHRLVESCLAKMSPL